MNGDVRGGLIYLGLAGLIGYAWVTGNLAKVVGYLTRAAGDKSVPGLQPEHPIKLPPLRPARTTSHPGGLTLIHA
jgi:hypothetical protein